MAAHSVKMRYFWVIFILSACIMSIVYEKTAATATHIPSIWLPLYKEQRKKKLNHMGKMNQIDGKSSEILEIELRSFFLLQSARLILTAGFFRHF